MGKVFPLAAMVRLRSQRETAAERALSEADAALRAAALKLRELERSMQADADSRLGEVGLLLNAVHHQSAVGYRAALTAQHVSQQKLLLELAAKRQVAQKHFLHTRREREMMTDLNAVWSEMRSREAEKREQRRLDDLSGSRSSKIATARIAGQARNKLQF